MPLVRACRLVMAFAWLALAGAAGAQHADISKTGSIAAFPGRIAASTGAPTDQGTSLLDGLLGTRVRVAGSTGAAPDPLLAMAAPAAGHTDDGGLLDAAASRGDTTRADLARVPAVPEPGNYLLLLAGLCVIGFLAFRRSGR